MMVNEEKRGRPEETATTSVRGSSKSRNSMWSLTPGHPGQKRLSVSLRPITDQGCKKNSSKCVKKTI